MKITYMEAITIEDATQQISELPAIEYQYGDQVIITYPNGEQIALVFRNTEQVYTDYIITPDGGL